jgi:AraC-like DNA-binding protein
MASPFISFLVANEPATLADQYDVALAYVVRRRLERAERMLRHTHLPLSEIAAAMDLPIKAVARVISTV